MKLLVFTLLCLATVSLCLASDVSDKPENFDVNYHYSSSDRPDPFVPYQKKHINIPPGQIGVEDAVLVGITMTARDGYVAVLRGSDGRVHYLSAGSKLFDGEVLKVDPQRVVFKQILPSGERVHEREVTKELHPEQSSN